MSHLSVAKKCLNGLKAKTCVILGSQWGDEGKGKLVDILAEKYDICGRFNGGANAGHTIVVNKKKYAFHLLPCGILYPNCTNVLGNGVVVNLSTMFEELKQLDRDSVNYAGRLLLSDRAHLVVNGELELDAKNETKGTGTAAFLGTTKKGIGPTYAFKAFRSGLRVGDLKNWDHFVQRYNNLNRIFKDTYGVSIDTERELRSLKEERDILVGKNMIIDSATYLNKALSQGKRILAEGANALMLDIDHGTYPYVTSSSTSVGGVPTGMGIPPSKIETVIGIVKAYTTRVGEGPFPTELKNELGEEIRKKGHEFGATTGRPRRCGWLDIPVLRYSHLINDYSSINITKLDILSDLDEIKIGIEYRINGKAIDYMPGTIDELSKVEVIYETVKGWKKDISKITNYNDLPKEAKDYIHRVEELLGVPVTWIGVGPEREAIITKN